MLIIDSNTKVSYLVHHVHTDSYQNKANTHIPLRILVLQQILSHMLINSHLILLLFTYTSSNLQQQKKHEVLEQLNGQAASVGDICG